MQLHRAFRLQLLIITACGQFAVAQTILKVEGKFGLADKHGGNVLKPEFDALEQAYFIVHYGDQIEKKNAGLPLYYVKRGDKYGYCYNVSFDSLTWHTDDYWVTSEFEFDSLYLLVVGTSRYHVGYGYSVLKYKQGGKWGILYVQTAASSGDGIFPSSGFYVDGLGKLYRKPAKYDEVCREQADYLFPTILNDTYGLVDPIRNEEYPAEFDTVPIMLDGNPSHLRYVRKNKRWGIVRLNSINDSIINITPCKCNEISQVSDGIYGCTGYGDTITFFDTLTHEEYVPKISGKPFIFDSSSVTFIVNSYGWGEQPTHPISIEVTRKDRPASDQFHLYYNEIYYINLKQHRVVTYNDTGSRYTLFQSLKNGLILKTPLKNKSPQTIYQFYTAESGEFRFSFLLDSNYQWSIKYYYPNNCRKEDEWIFYEFYYYNGKGERITLGYYDHLQQKFTRRKPKYKPKPN